MVSRRTTDRRVHATMLDALQSNEPDESEDLDPDTADMEWESDFVNCTSDDSLHDDCSPDTSRATIDTYRSPGTGGLSRGSVDNHHHWDSGHSGTTVDNRRPVTSELSRNTVENKQRPGTGGHSRATDDNRRPGISGLSRNSVNIQRTRIGGHSRVTVDDRRPGTSGQCRARGRCSVHSQRAGNGGHIRATVDDRRPGTSGLSSGSVDNQRAGTGAHRRPGTAGLSKNSVGTQTGDHSRATVNTHPDTSGLSRGSVDYCHPRTSRNPPRPCTRRAQAAVARGPSLTPGRDAEAQCFGDDVEPNVAELADMVPTMLDAATTSSTFKLLGQILELLKEQSNEIKKIRKQLGGRTSKTVVPGFTLPLANPDMLVRLNHEITEKLPLQKALKKYLIELGMDAGNTTRTVARVMGGILTDYAGYFLNFQGIKTGDTIVNTVTQRIGLKKVAPSVHAAIESAYAEVANETKLFSLADLRAKTVTWFSKRKTPQPGEDAEGNELDIDLPWVFSDDCLDILNAVGN